MGRGRGKSNLALNGEMGCSNMRPSEERGHRGCVRPDANRNKRQGSGKVPRRQQEVIRDAFRKHMRTLTTRPGKVRCAFREMDTHHMHVRTLYLPRVSLLKGNPYTVSPLYEAFEASLVPTLSEVPSSGSPTPEGSHGPTPGSDHPQIPNHHLVLVGYPLHHPGLQLPIREFPWRRYQWPPHHLLGTFLACLHGLV